MVQVSGTNDRYLKKTVALPVIFKIMEPNLIWTDRVPAVGSSTRAVQYKYDTYSKSSDPKKETAPIHAESAKFPELDKTRMSSGAALTIGRGFSMRVDRDAVTQVDGANEITEAYETAGFWLAEYINTNILSALTGGATTPTWTPTAEWSGATATATPVDDLIKLGAEMDREGYPFRMTDIFVDKTNWYELKSYLTSIDIGDFKQKTMYGVPEITQDRIHVPVVGADVHKVMSGLTHGYVLAIDANNPAATTHYYNDPKYSTATVSYETMVDGKPVRKTVNNIGIHFNQYEENDTHDTILQFWVDNVTVVKKPYGLLYDNGI